MIALPVDRLLIRQTNDAGSLSFIDLESRANSNIVFVSYFKAAKSINSALNGSLRVIYIHVRDNAGRACIGVFPCMAHYLCYANVARMFETRWLS